MIRFIIRFAIVVALAGLFSWLADRPGVLRIDWLDRRIEAPLAVAVIVLFIAFSACLWLFGLMRRALRAPGSMSEIFRARRNRRGYESLSRGMIAIGAGDLQTARRHSQIAAKFLNDEPLARLLEAQTAQASGDNKRVALLFDAMAKTKEAKLLGLRGLFNQARQSGDLARAGKLAAEALKIHSGLPWASNATLMIQSSERNWQGVAETLEGQRRSRVIDDKTANRKRAVVLTAQAAEKEKAAPAEALQLALRAHKLDPALVPAAVIAARLYAGQGQARKAARIIERTFPLHPHAELVRVYSFQKSGLAPRERLKKAEQLVARFGGGEEAAVGVTEAAIAALDWTKAKAVLEPFVTDRPRARVCALMAEIADGEGDKGLAREWLARGMRAPPDPKWTADGIVSEQWQPVSPVTGELGAFQWKVPVERLAYEAVDTPEALPTASARNEALAEEAAPGPETPESQSKATEPVTGGEMKGPFEARAEQQETKRGKSVGPPVTLPLPDDPGPEREDDRALTGGPEDWARRLAGSG
jgi:HemY protein